MPSQRTARHVEAVRSPCRSHQHTPQDIQKDCPASSTEQAEVKAKVEREMYNRSVLTSTLTFKILADFFSILLDESFTRQRHLNIILQFRALSGPQQLCV